MKVILKVATKFLVDDFSFALQNSILIPFPTARWQRRTHDVCQCQGKKHYFHETAVLNGIILYLTRKNLLLNPGLFLLRRISASLLVSNMALCLQKQIVYCLLNTTASLYLDEDTCFRVGR